MARLIPPIIDPGTKSAGERELFLRLKHDPACESWTVLHSLDLADHVRQLQGEVDFVVIIPELGVLCLEVKAHHEVRVEEGVWLFGRQRKQDKSPFRQASEAMHSVRRQLSKQQSGLSHVVCWVVSSCLRSRLFLEYCLYKANSKAASSRFRIAYSCSI